MSRLFAIVHIAFIIAIGVIMRHFRFMGCYMVNLVELVYVIDLLGCHLTFGHHQRSLVIRS